MNVLLISTNNVMLPMPVMPIGTCLTAEAVEAAGHGVRVLDLMFARDPVDSINRAIIDFRPDAVGLGIRNIDNNDMRDPAFLLNDLKHYVTAVRRLTGAPIILGGAAMSIMPEAILRMADLSCGVTGDGASLFPLLLERISHHAAMDDLPGIAWMENGSFRSNDGFGPEPALPAIAPDYRKWVDVASYQAQLATAPVQTKTGCAFRCVYCTYRKLDGEPFRLQDPAAVAQAVQRLAAGGLRDIEFVDSVFNEPYHHALALCEELARIKHRARLQSLELNPRSFDDRLIDAMKRAGFVALGLTVESASDAVLEGLGKSFTSREVHHASEVLRQQRIPCAWIFLLGGPGETEDTVRETLRFAERALGPRDIAFFNIGIRVYPGTPLEDIARRDGMLTVPPSGMLRPVFYVSPRTDVAWIRAEVKRSMARCMHFINTDSIGMSILPAIHRVARRLRVRPPLWRYTRIIRRGLRLFGMDV